MMKFKDFLRFGIILKPKNKIKYTKLYCKNKDKKTIGGEL